LGLPIVRTVVDGSRSAIRHAAPTAVKRVAFPPKDDSRRELLSGADHRRGLEIVENASYELFVRPLPDERRIKDSFELGRERSRFVASWEFRLLVDCGEPAGDLRSP
jgi:hypothetical protein